MKDNFQEKKPNNPLVGIFLFFAFPFIFRFPKFFFLAVILLFAYVFYKMSQAPKEGTSSESKPNYTALERAIRMRQERLTMDDSSFSPLFMEGITKEFEEEPDDYSTFTGSRGYVIHDDHYHNPNHEVSDFLKAYESAKNKGVNFDPWDIPDEKPPWEL